MNDSKVEFNQNDFQDCQVGCQEVNVTNVYNQFFHGSEKPLEDEDITQLARELAGKLREEARITSGDMVLPVELDHPINAVALEISSDLQPDRERMEGTGHYNRRADFLNVYEQPEGDIALQDLFKEALGRAETESLKKCRLKPLQERYVRCHGNIVGVVGQAGIGKTTLAKILAKKILDEGLLEAEFIFYIPFRMINYDSESNLLQFLVTSSSCRWRHTARSDEALLKEIEQSFCCVIILDGLDEAIMDNKSASYVSPDDAAKAELFIKNILNGKILPRAKKFVTSRPRQMFDLHRDCRPNFIVNVLGLSKKSQEQLCREICGEDAPEVLRYLEEHPDISAYCYVPVNCILTAHCIHRSLLDEEEANLDSITSVLVYALLGFVRSEHIRDNASFEPHKLSQLAWNGFMRKKIIFDEEDFKEFEINEETLRAFLETYVDSSMRVKILEGDKRSYFSHLIWQEFFTALYMMMSMLAAIFEQEIVNFGDGRWEVVNKFIFGLTNPKSFKSLQKILPPTVRKNVTMEEWNKKKCLLQDYACSLMPAEMTNVTCPDFLRVCGFISESNDCDITNHVIAHAPLDINLSENILPSDVTSLHYFLSHSKKEHVINVGFGSAFNSVRFLGDGFERFFRGLAEDDRTKHVKLRKVMVERSSITDAGIRHLTKRMTEIEELTLYKTGLSHLHVEILAKSIKTIPKMMKKLDLVENAIGEVGSRALATCLFNLNSLILSACDLNVEAVKVLAGAISRRDQPMERLYLPSNRKLGYEGGLALIPVLPKTKYLNCNHCNIPAAGIESICKAWRDFSEPEIILNLDTQFDDINLRRKENEKLSDSARGCLQATRYKDTE
ncbi:NACHT, LRR and PYD domains-containing protein 3-like isoform X2 [Clavelina lepadiformis]